jgi:hypothetical protein
MKRVLFAGCLVLSFHCGSETRLRSVISCADDLSCPIGYVCAEDHSACLEVTSDDVASWTKPTTSDALYERLGGMALSNTNPGVTQLISFGGATTMVTQQVSEAAVRARVHDGALELWELHVFASGGTMTIWPTDPSTRDLSIEVPIRSVELTLPNGVKAALTEGVYPHAATSMAVPVRVVATIGDETEAEVSITTYLDSAKLDATFDVIDARVQVTLHIEADVPRVGNEGWLRVEHLDITVPLTAPNDIPQPWLEP